MMWQTKYSINEAQYIRRGPARAGAGRPRIQAVLYKVLVIF